jgi:hypothetical protein
MTYLFIARFLARCALIGARRCSSGQTCQLKPERRGCLRNGSRAGRSGQRAEPAVARLDLLCNEFTRGSRAFHLERWNLATAGSALWPDRPARDPFKLRPSSLHHTVTACYADGPGWPGLRGARDPSRPKMITVTSTVAVPSQLRLGQLGLRPGVFSSSDSGSQALRVFLPC